MTLNKKIIIAYFIGILACSLVFLGIARFSNSDPFGIMEKANYVIIIAKVLTIATIGYLLLDFILRKKTSSKLYFTITIVLVLTLILYFLFIE